MREEVVYAALSEFVYNQHGNDQALTPGDLGLGENLIASGDASITPAEKETGFHVEAYEYDGKTVFAFRGTDFAHGFLGADFTQGNVPLAFGDVEAPQWVAAQRVIDDYRENNSDKELVFTGHSLGGGLAALAAAKYGYQAHIFAPAPFKNTSESPDFVPLGLSAAQEQLLLIGAPEAPDVPLGPGGIPNPTDPAYLLQLAEYLAQLANFDQVAYDAAVAERDVLGGVDGFDQDECGGECDKGTEVPSGFLAA